MVNSIMLVGKLGKKIEKGDNEFLLVIPRIEKNEEGIYEKDIIPIICWEGISERMVEYCGEGDTIGVRGRVEIREGNVVLIAEKITFLSSKKVDKKEE